MADVIDRFETPLYTVAEAATYLGVPNSTFQSWTRGYTNRPKGRRIVKGEPVVTAFDSRGGRASVPFVGLAEGMVLAAIRRQGVPLQRIRPALDALKAELGLAHALASRRLYTDGAEVLYDYAERHKEDPEARVARELVVVRNNQRVFSEIVEDYLSRLQFGDDGNVVTIRLPGYERAQVVVDANRSWGKPIFLNGGARITDALERFWAGDDLDEVAEEFGVPRQQLEDALRVASHRAA